MMDVTIFDVWETRGVSVWPTLFPAWELLQRANSQPEVFFLKAGKSE